MSMFGSYWRPAPFIKGYLILFAQELCRLYAANESTHWLQYVLTPDDIHGIPPGKCVQINIRFINADETIVILKDE